MRSLNELGLIGVYRSIGAQPAPELNRDAGGFHNLADHAAVHRLPGLRPIQIDDMDTVGAEFDPLAGDRGRVVGEHGFLRVVALPKPHAAAVQQVDCRVDEHDLARPAPAPDSILDLRRYCSPAAGRKQGN